MKKVLLFSIAIFICLSSYGQTLTTAKSNWTTIKNETAKGANTATRVGNAGISIVEAVRDTLINFNNVDVLKTKTGTKTFFQYTSGGFNYLEPNGSVVFSLYPTTSILSSGNSTFQLTPDSVNIYDPIGNSVIKIDNNGTTINDTLTAPIIKLTDVYTSGSKSLFQLYKNEIRLNTPGGKELLIYSDSTISLKNPYQEKDFIYANKDQTQFNSYNGDEFISSTVSENKLKGFQSNDFLNSNVTGNHIRGENGDNIIFDMLRDSILINNSDGDRAISIHIDSIYFKKPTNLPIAFGSANYLVQTSGTALTNSLTGGSWNVLKGLNDTGEMYGIQMSITGDSIKVLTDGDYEITADITGYFSGAPSWVELGCFVNGSFISELASTKYSAGELNPTTINRHIQNIVEVPANAWIDLRIKETGGNYIFYSYAMSFKVKLIRKL